MVARCLTTAILAALAATGCDSVPQPQPQPQPFPYQTEYVIADVQLMPPPKDVAETPYLDSILRDSILQCLKPVREVENEIHTVDVLAWSLKGDLFGKVPDGIFEEVLLLVKWKGVGSWELFYLKRYPSYERRWVPGRVYWSHTPTPWRREFSVKPTDNELSEFARQTDFGNNEPIQGYTPLLILAYAHAPPKLSQELAAGVGPEERKRRHWDMPEWD